MTETEGLLPSNSQFLMKKAQQKIPRPDNKTDQPEPKLTKPIIWNWAMYHIVFHGDVHPKVMVCSEILQRYVIINCFIIVSCCDLVMYCIYAHIGINELLKKRMWILCNFDVWLQIRLYGCYVPILSKLVFVWVLWAIWFFFGLKTWRRDPGMQIKLLPFFFYLSPWLPSWISKWPPFQHMLA